MSNSTIKKEDGKKEVTFNDLWAIYEEGDFLKVASTGKFHKVTSVKIIVGGEGDKPMINEIEYQLEEVSGATLCDDTRSYDDTPGVLTPRQMELHRASVALLGLE